MNQQRRLAAILVADVVGYSMLVGSDETGTLACLESLRREVVAPVLGKHSGRLFKSVGDGFLVEFSSAVQAVTAAQAIQQANATGALQLRIGIHVGDVVVQGDDLMGDGVNIAARIEGVADPGGIAISRAVYEQVRDRLNVGFSDKGEVELKNIARPVHVFAVAGPKTAQPTTALPLPDKPSIAVLPFQNMSGDPEQEYFADGVVEDVITGLSRNRELFVIARNSSFTYKGKAVDVRQVGRELGVRYVLEGSVRRAGPRIRITGQLIDAQSGAHLWADRFDGALEDVFELQDQVTSSVVSALGPTIERAEIARSFEKPTEILQAYDHYLQGLAHFYRYTKEANEKALEHFQSAARADQDYARAFIQSAMCLSVRRAMAWSPGTDPENIQAEQWVRRALQLNSRDPFVLARAGSVLAYLLRKNDECLALLERALELDPNDAFAWTWNGWARVWLGRPEEAIDRFEHALRLNPFDPQIVHTQTGMASALGSMDRYDDSELWAMKALQELPNYPPALRMLVRAQALAGRIDDARQSLAVYLKVDPQARVSNLRQRFAPGNRNDLAEKLLAAFRLAGLPE